MIKLCIMFCVCLSLFSCKSPTPAPTYTVLTGVIVPTDSWTLNIRHFYADSSDSVKATAVMLKRLYVLGDIPLAPWWAEKLAVDPAIMTTVKETTIELWQVSETCFVYKELSVTPYFQETRGEGQPQINTIFATAPFWKNVQYKWVGKQK